MIKKYKHFSFDLDGTLVHTVPEYRHDVVPKVVSQLGGKIDDKFFIDRFWFESNRDAIIKNHFGINPKNFWDLFLKMDTPEKRGLHTKAYDDSETALRKLKAAGKIISIITGAPHWVAKMEIQKLNGAPYDFHFSIRDSEFNIKPDPASFRFVLNKLQVEAKDTVYIGNSDEDAYFARNVGVDFIYLERKEHPFNLQDYAITTIHSLEHLFA